MAKVAARKIAPARLRAAPERSAAPELEHTARAEPGRALSEFSVLLAEVDRLRAELAASRAQVKELEASADIDPLTGVFNRRGFDRELKRSLSYVKRYGTRAALIYLDLDGFKPVNDRYGHAAGDAVLKATAETLTHSVRASDTVARLGGDEFGLLLWNLSESDATAKAWALEAAVSDAGIEWEAEVLSVGASVGFAMLGAADDLADVLARADQAMYARKAQRNGGVVLPRRASWTFTR